MSNDFDTGQKKNIKKKKERKKKRQEKEQPHCQFNINIFAFGN